MKEYVFTGPTISAAEAGAELAAVYLPPASQGDVYRLTRKRPRAIGLVDGYFECVPAVWHKEILWAMSQGIHVFGSSSMGALRAAELHVFGMVGVGEIFEAFRRGDLEDDDEVAVTHGPAELGFRAISEAMVNIRATLRAAKENGVISADMQEKLQQIAKSFFYRERTYDRLLTCAAESGMARRELEAFASWLSGGRVDRKRLDAISMLRAMRTFLADNPGPKRVRYTFEHTQAWDHVRRTVR